MSVMRFVVHPTDRLSPDAIQRAYLSGLDRVPYVGRAVPTGDGLRIERADSDSGCLNIPYPVEGRGELTLSTGSLMDRDRPYHLQVELARGKVNHVRSQMAEWQAIGLNVPPELQSRIREAQQQFAKAATSQHDPANAAIFSEKAIQLALDASDQLGVCYVQQAIAVRTRQGTALESQLAVSLGNTPLSAEMAQQIRPSFNAAAVPLSWRHVGATEGTLDFEASDAQVEWCQSQGMPLYAGPLLRFDAESIPDWLCLWEGDYDNLVGCVSEYVETCVKRYRGKVNLWHCTSGVNVGSFLSLSEDEKLRLAVRVFELTRHLDPSTPAILSFDQPWAEYMMQREIDPPLYVADVLARSGLGISGIGLELNLGYYPGGSYLRDLLDFSRLIDHWSLLGLPLFVTLAIASSDEVDPQAHAKGLPIPDAFPGGWNEENQRRCVHRIIPLLLAKPAVRSVIWRQLQDAVPHAYAHAGLFNHKDQAKPALSALAEIRQEYLK